MTEPDAGEQPGTFRNSGRRCVPGADRKSRCHALDENLADVFLKEHDDLAQTKVELSYEPQRVVAGVVKGEEDLLAEINRMIAEVTEQKLYVQWLDAATLQAVKLEADSID